MTMTTMMLALIAWLLISCAIAWGVGRASNLGQTEEQTAASPVGNERRERTTSRRADSDRRKPLDRRAAAREGYERRVMDRRLIQRRLSWAP